MGIKVYKTNKAARRKASIVDRSGLSKGLPHRALLKTKTRTSGRGSSGKMTVRSRGGGAKRRVRVVDFGQEKLGVSAKVESIQFDPGRSAFVVLLLYVDGERRYALAWDGAKVGDAVLADEKAPEAKGNRMRLKHVTPGLTVYNVEVRPGRGGKLLRSAGVSASLMDVKAGQALLKMASGEVRVVSADSFANIGAVGNSDHRLARCGSAGRKRRLGRRPRVRGKAMNPVDHPHGGGEGGSPIGLKQPKTKWGKKAMGVRTRSKRKYSDRLIINRRRK